METVKWVTLVLCAILTASRLPAALGGRQRSVFAAFALVSIAVALSINGIYLAVDSVLGGRNYANLLLRGVLLAVFLILGTKVSDAYRCRWASVMIKGPIGIAALALVALATAALFLLSDLPTSSTGLSNYGHLQSVQWYSRAGLAYPAYVAACLICPTAVAAFRPGTGLNRSASGLLCFGFLLVLTAALLPPAGAGFAFLSAVVSYAAILSVAVGLTLIWVSRRLHLHRRSRTLRIEK